MKKNSKKKVVKAVKKVAKKIPKPSVSLPPEKKKYGPVSIGGRLVGEGQPVYIIAEIGINHNGDIELAKKLIDKAKEVGCDAVKFQKRTVEVVYTPEELAKPRPVEASILLKAVKRGVLPPDAVKRLKESDFENSTNGDLKRALELTEAEYREIDRYAKEKGIAWFASPWDEQSVDFLEQFNPPAYKIASASITDNGLLKHTRAKNRPMIVSTGMSDLDIVKKAVETLGKDNLVLMHTVSTYPANPEELNLKAIHTLRDEFGIPVGYSGHEVGMSPAFAAAVMGASVVERHITLDRAMWGSDQAASMEPFGFGRLVSYIRFFEKTKGTGEKKILESEVPVMKKLRRK